MKFNRDVVTPYLGVVFIVVAMSGILMFFHLLDDYTNVVHEFLGVTFTCFAALHMITNWKSLENYGKKRKVLLPSIIILSVSISLIVMGKVKGNLERELMERMIQAPVCYSFKTLNIDSKKAAELFSAHHIIVRDSLQSIVEIGEANKKSPDQIIELIFQ